ncbi:MAG: S-methyl-5'-thioadenosine phosphorylase [Caldisericia bacterium]|nr:S-methyl-5'-thioadenosine phosphorylase [Caldisericia bacterium]
MGKKFGVIGGSGFYDLPGVKEREKKEIITPFGSVEVSIGEIGDREIVFVPRHGKTHTIPPHLIPYRANIWAMKEIGVERILATSASGSLNENMKPGDFVIIDQFLDFTHDRDFTFFDSVGKVVHTDMTDPYCPEMRDVIRKVMEKEGVRFHFAGTYVAMNGPRYESRAEIKMLKILGGDIVGMTGVPEVTLARELGLCYASIGIVTNFAAGITDEMITHEEVKRLMDEKSEILKKIIIEVIKLIPEERHCNCRFAPGEV